MSNAVVQTTEFELDLQDAATVDLEIRRFVTGQTSGGAVLEALYGEIAEEPIPASFLKILRG